MSHFYGSMQGCRGEATRCGSKGSGFEAHIRGWDMGIQVYLTYNEYKDRDEAEVYLTSGSGSNKASVHIGTFIKGGKLTEQETQSVDPVLRLGEPRRVEHAE